VGAALAISTQLKPPAAEAAAIAAEAFRKSRRFNLAVIVLSRNRMNYAKPRAGCHCTPILASPRQRSAVDKGARGDRHAHRNSLRRIGLGTSEARHGRKE